MKESAASPTVAPLAPEGDHLTIRLDANGAAAGTDDGTMWALGHETAARIRELASSLRPAVGAEGPTPAARASYGEADRLRIVDSADAPAVATPTDHWVQRLAADVCRPVPSPPRRPRAPSRPLDQVLTERASRAGTGPVPGDTLHVLLERLREPRQTALDAAGRAWESRPYPSAGGTHSLDVLVLARHVTGWRNGWYRWQPHDGPVPVLPPRTRDAVTAIGLALRGRETSAYLLAVADLPLLHARYPNGAALGWRDAGCLLATAHLIATDLGLASTIVGATAALDPACGSARPGDIRLLGALALAGPPAT